MNQRGNLMIGIVIGAVVVLGLLGAYYLGTKSRNSSSNTQQNSNVYTPNTPVASANVPTPPKQVDLASEFDISKWQTYQSNAVLPHKFAFKYPSNWTNDVSDQLYLESGVLIHTNDVSYTDFSHFQKGALIYTFFAADALALSSGDTLDTLATKTGSDFKNANFISQLKTSVGTQPAIESVFKDIESESAIVVFILPDGKNYKWFIMTSAVADFNNNMGLFNQMLASFTFN